MDNRKLQQQIELALLVSPTALSVTELSKITGVDPEVIEQALHNLIEHYQNSQHGFGVRETKAGYGFYSKPEFSETVQKVLGVFDALELSQPALETLAIIAYRSPVSRTEISRIRGVQTEGILRTLLSYGLVERIINPEDNRTYLYQLTPYCFEQFGIVDESELPPLAPYLPENFVELGITDEFYDFRKKSVASVS